MKQKEQNKTFSRAKNQHKMRLIGVNNDAK